MIKPVDDDIGELMRMMQAEHLRATEPLPHQVEQIDNEQPNSRQIAHPTSEPKQKQDLRQGGPITQQEQQELKADSRKVASTSETANNARRPPSGQQFGVQVGGRPSQEEFQQIEEVLGSVENWERTETFINDIVNPRTKQMADAHGFDSTQSRDRLEQSFGGRRSQPSDVEGEFFDATQDVPEEFLPEEVVSGPTGVWDTAELPSDAQPTLTNVRVKKG